MTRQAVVASTGIAACVLLPLLIFPERALALMGAEFVAAADYLRIMAFAQFATALLGPLAMILHMTERERESMWINLGTLALALGLVPVFRTALGALGFGLAYSALIILKFGLTGLTVMFRTKPALFQNGVNL